MKQKILSLHKFLPKRTLINISSAFCVLLLYIFIAPHVAPHALATGITVSNVTFEPYTGAIAFDYTGDNLSGTSLYVTLYDTTKTTGYWVSGSASNCTSSHCTAALALQKNDSGLSSVILHIGGGQISDDSQTLTYPLPLPSGDYHGTITSVIAGTGLTGGATQGDATLALANAGVTTAILADGAVTTAKLADASVTTAKIADGAVTASKLSTDLSVGWYAANETWTYASADAPTFTFTVSGDDTGKYSPGMRIKLDQTTTEYFLITGVSYSSPNTTVTIYGGTDYTLANATITNTYYSMVKAPVGFPLNPSKWTVQVSDSTTRNQGSPTASTWYNLGSDSITVPIGMWNVSYNVDLIVDRTDEGQMFTFVTLSTSNSSESDSDFTGQIGGASISSGLGDEWAGANETREKVLNLSSKTTYYLNTMTNQSGIDNIWNSNGASKLFIRAVCAYL